MVYFKFPFKIFCFITEETDIQEIHVLEYETNTYTDGREIKLGEKLNGKRVSQRGTEGYTSPRESKNQEQRRSP